MLLALHSDLPEGGPQEGPPAQEIRGSYLAALRAAGAVPVLLPTGLPLPSDLSFADGLLLAGGADIDPSRYREQPDPTTEADPDLDAAEFQLLDWALAEGVPVLGICRGIQVLNVALGGTLFQDLPSQRPSGVDHRPGGARDLLAHGFRVEAGSRLAELAAAPGLEVNSLHHQGLREIAGALRPTAWSEDGLVEGVEMAGTGWVLGVQFHPEELWQQMGFASRLLSAFADACRGRRQTQRKTLTEVDPARA